VDTEEYFPWPSPDDDIFGRSDGDWRGIATVEGLWANADLYALGYREAAGVLVAHALERGDTDLLVYPTLFLYRQYVELRLKHIAVAASSLLDRDPPPTAIMLSHELEPLWGFCRGALEAEDEGPTEDLDNAERTLRQLGWADPGSYSFRYPTDKKGARSLPSTLERVDLRQVGEVMAGVGNLLDAIVDHLSVQQDAKNEWLAEMETWRP
jgi:hypothetical protein